MSEETNEAGGMTRLSFIKATAGAAAGAAAISVPGAAAAMRKEDAAVPTAPSSPTPREPVIAYVRNADRGEVTVVSGTNERTYRDRALTRRLIKAAPRHANRKAR
jgi:hypothetical protein